MLASIVIGYEIYGRLKELMDRDGDWDGVTVSGFVAPAIAGRLMGLDAQAARACAGALSGARAVDAAGGAAGRHLGREVGVERAGRAERHAG